jgi:2'-5' RNA ligase
VADQWWEQDAPVAAEPENWWSDDAPANLAQTLETVYEHDVAGSPWLNLAPNLYPAAVAGGAGIAAPVLRMFGQDEEATRLQARASALGKASEQLAQQSTDYPIIPRAVRGVVASLPTAKLGAKLGGAYGSLGAAGVSASDSAYHEARVTGMPEEQAVEYAKGQGVIEFGVGAVFQKLGLGGLESVLASKTPAVQGGIREALKRAGVNLVNELGEEHVTEIAHAVQSKLTGVDPNALSAEAMQQLVADTTAQTILTMGLVEAPGLIDAATGRKPAQPAAPPASPQGDFEIAPGLFRTDNEASIPDHATGRGRVEIDGKVYYTYNLPQDRREPSIVDQLAAPTSELPVTDSVSVNDQPRPDVDVPPEDEPAPGHPSDPVTSKIKQMSDQELGSLLAEVDTELDAMDLDDVRYDATSIYQQLLNNEVRKRSGRDLFTTRPVDAAPKTDTLSVAQVPVVKGGDQNAETQLSPEVIEQKEAEGDQQRQGREGLLEPSTTAAETKVATLEPTPLGDATSAPSGVSIAPTETPNAAPASPQPSGVPETAPQAGEEVADTRPAREFSSTQVNLPGGFAKKVRDAGKQIADEDLAEKGRESEPHVTVKFGLHTNDVEEVRPLIESEPPIRLKLGKTSTFAGGENGDVVKVDVESDDLRRINAAITAALPHTDTHPDYKPHVTLGYVRPGLGQKYAGRSDLEGTEIVLDRIVFSDKERNHHEIKLLGGKRATKGNAKRKAPAPAPETRELMPLNKWREWLSDTDDPSRKKDILRIVADKSKNDSDLSEVINLTAGSGLPDGGNVLWAVHKNPNASEETKARAKTEYEAYLTSLDADEPAAEEPAAPPKVGDTLSVNQPAVAAAPLEPAPKVSFHRGPDDQQDETFWQEQADKYGKMRVEIEDAKKKLDKELGNTRRNAHIKRGKLQGEINDKQRSLNDAERSLEDAQRKLSLGKLEAMQDNPPTPAHGWAAKIRIAELLRYQISHDPKQRNTGSKEIHDLQVEIDEDTLRILPFAEAAVRKAGLIDAKDIERAAHTTVDRFASGPWSFNSIEDAADHGVQAVRRERLGSPEFSEFDRASQRQTWQPAQGAYGELTTAQVDDFRTQLQEAVKDDSGWRDKTAKIFDEAKALSKKQDDEKEAARKVKADSDRKAAEDRAAEVAVAKRENIKKAVREARYWKSVTERARQVKGKKEVTTIPLSRGKNEATDDVDVPVEYLSDVWAIAEIPEYDAKNGWVKPKLAGVKGKTFSLIHLPSKKFARSAGNSLSIKELWVHGQDAGLDWDSLKTEQNIKANEIIGRVDRAWDNKAIHEHILSGDEAIEAILSKVPQSKPLPFESDLVLGASELGYGTREPAPFVGTGRLKEFADSVPEFRYNPLLTVNDKKQLVFRDGYKFTFAPDAFNLAEGELTSGMTVGINLPEMGIKLATEQEVVAEMLEGQGFSNVRKPNSKTVAASWKGMKVEVVQQGKEDWSSASHKHLTGNLKEAVERANQTIDRIRWQQPDDPDAGPSKGKAGPSAGQMSSFEPKPISPSPKGPSSWQIDQGLRLGEVESTDNVSVKAKPKPKKKSDKPKGLSAESSGGPVLSVAVKKKQTSSITRASVVNVFPGAKVSEVPGGWRVEVGQSYIDIEQVQEIELDWEAIGRQLGRPVPQDMRQKIAAAGQYTLTTNDGRKHDGLGIIKLVEGLADDATLRHEAIHLAKRAGIVTPAEWKSLAAEYGRGSTNEELVEERIAESREAWKSEGKIWDRIVSWFRRLLASIGVTRNTAKDIQLLMDEAEFWQRPAKGWSNKSDPVYQLRDAGQPDARVTKVFGEGYKVVRLRDSDNPSLGDIHEVTMPNGKVVYVKADHDQILLSDEQYRLMSESYGLPEVMVRSGETKGVYTAEDLEDGRRFAVIHTRKDDKGGTLAHEKLHALMDLLYTPEEKAKVSKRYGHEEFAAEAYRRRTTGGDGLMDRMRGFIERAGDVFSGIAFPVNPKTGVMYQLKGRPELANPATDPAARDLVDEVDQKRKEAGEPKVRSDADVRSEATRRIAADYAGERTRLLEAGRTGEQLSDVDTVIAKTIVNREAVEAVKSTDSVSVKDAMTLIDAYRRTGTEQGRAFRQRRDPVETPAERMRRNIVEAILSPPAKTQKKIDKARANGDESEAQRLLDEWIKQFEALKKRLLELGVDLDNLNDMGYSAIKEAEAIAVIAAAKHDNWDRAYEYWRNGILTAFTTHFANTTSNVTHAAWHFTAERLVEAGLNAVTQRPEGAQVGELKYLVAGILPGLSRGARNFLLTMRTEIPQLDKQLGRHGQYDIESADVAIPGQVGKYIRLPQRMLLAADDFARSLYVNMEVGARAYRLAKAEGLSGEDLQKRIQELSDDIESEAWDDAYGISQELVFQQRGSSVAKHSKDAILGLRRGVMGLRYLVPFVTTPVNIFDTAIRKSPFGSIGVANAMYKNYREGKNVLDGQTAAVAQQLLAWAVVLALLGNDEDDPWITGAAVDFDPKTRALASRTYPSQSVKLGGRWFKYARVEPFATIISSTVDAVNALKSGSGKRASTIPFTSIIGQLKDKTFMSGIGDIMQAMEQPQDRVPRWASNFAVSWIPNIARTAGRAAEESRDETKVWGDGADWWAMLGKRTLQKAEIVPVDEHPAYDLWGRPVVPSTSPVPRTDWLYRMTVPSESREEKITPGDRMLLNWNNQNPDELKSPEPIQTYVRRGGQTKYLTDEEYAAVAKLSGQVASKVIEGRKWNLDNPTEADIEALEGIVADSRSAARDFLLTGKSVPSFGKPDVDKLAKAAQEKHVESLQRVLRLTRPDSLTAREKAKGLTLRDKVATWRDKRADATKRLAELKVQ